MKAKKHISKKLLALLLSVLMVVTAIPLVAIPATAAEATASPNFYSTITTGTRGESGRIAMTNDGEAQSTSIGILRFDISSWPANVASAKMKFGVSRDSNYHQNASIGFYSATKNFDTVANSPQASGRFNEILGSSFSSNSTTHINSAKTYFGLGSPFASIALSSMNAGRSGNWNYGEKEIDVTSAVNAAKAANQSVLQIIIMHPQSYYSNPWSDVNISSDSVKLTYSYDASVPSVPTGILPASTVASTNSSTLTYAQARNTNVTTVHGNFSNDDDYLEQSHYDAIYHNILHSDSITTTNYNTDHSAAIDYTPSDGWVRFHVRWFYGRNTIMMYDGATTPTTGIMVVIGPEGQGTGDGHSHFRSVYIENGDGLSLKENWHGSDNHGSGSDKNIRLNMQWNYLCSGHENKISKDKVNDTSCYEDTNQRRTYANLIQYNGSMSDSTWFKSITPHWGFFCNTYNKFSSATFQSTQSNNAITVINYKPLKAAINSADSMIAAVRANPSKYDPAWVRSLVVASNALMAAKPNNYINASSTDVAGYASAASAAVSQFNLVAAPYNSNSDSSELATYRITYKTTDGSTTLKTVDYKYDSYVNIKNNAPANSNPTQKNSTHHTVYDWNNLPGNVTVTDNLQYNERSVDDVHNLTNCTSVSETQHKKTCSVCGYISTENHNLSRVEIADNNDQHQLRCNDCGYDTTENHSYGAEQVVSEATCINNKVVKQECSQCNHVWQHEVADTATGVHVWETTGTVTKEPTWNEKGQTTYKCTTPGCTATDVRDDIPALGDDVAPTGTVTFRGYVCGNDSDMISIINRGFEENPSFDLFPQAGSTVRTAITDPDSGVASTEYFIADRVYTLEEVRAKADGWTAVTSNRIDLPLNTEGTFVVYVKASDNAGNVAYFSAPGYSVDKTNPVVTLPESENNVFCVSASVTVSDANLKTVTLDGTEVELADGKLAVTAPGEHTVVATDKGGNEATVTFTVNAKHQGGTANCVDKAVCELCGQEYGEVDANNHKSLSDEIAGKDATCTEDGYTAYRHCDACNQDVGKETIKAAGHHNIAYRSNGDGTHTSYCTECSEYVGQTVACSGTQYTGVYENAACEHPARRQYRCDTCGNTYWVNEYGSSATGHRYEDNNATFNWTEVYDTDGNVIGWTCDTATFKCVNSGCDHGEEVAAKVTENSTSATCTDKGTKTFTASAAIDFTINISGNEYPRSATATSTKTVDGEAALNHEWNTPEFTWSIAEDGTVSATATRTCQRDGCGKKETVNAEVNKTDEVTATCTVEGSATYTATATFDGTEYTSPNPYTVDLGFDSDNHVNTEVIEAVAATCTKAGSKEGLKCSDCGTVITKPEEILALGHDWGDPVFSEWTADNTCTATRTCKRVGCGESETLDVNISSAPTTTATCTVPGVVTYTATVTVDGKTFTSTNPVTGATDPNNHNFVETGRTPATCTTDGFISYSCTACGATKSEKYADKLNHSYGEVSYIWAADHSTCTATRVCGNDETHVDTATVNSTREVTTEATCQVAEVVTYTASGEFDDGTKFETSADVTGSTVDHSFTNYVSNNDATCTANGTETAHCDYGCNKTDTREVADSMLSHTLTKTEAKASTCTENGNNEYWTCSECHKVFKADKTTETTVAAETLELDSNNHSFTNYVADNNATCTANGTETAHCDYGCNKTDTREVADSMLSHTLTKTEAKASTCTEKGNNEYWTCSECHKLFKADKVTETTVEAETLELDANNHSFTNYVSNDDATCTANGTETAHCDYGCGKTDTREVADSMLSHTLTKTEAKASTCTEKGNNEYWTCSVCHKVFKADKTTETTVESETLALDADNHNWGDWEIDKPATCTEKGEKHRVCKLDASHVENGEIDVDPENHDFSSEFTVDKEATCTEKGSKSRHCSRCDAKTDITEIDLIAHTLTKTEAKVSTCTEKGNNEYWTCSECHKVFKADKVTETTVEAETLELDSNNHSFTNYVSNDDASCTKNATETAKCDRCDAEDTREIADSMLPHTHTKYEHIDGTKTHKSVCDVCDGDEKIADCTPSEWITDKEATYTEDGSKHKECTACHAVLETEKIPALSHHWGKVELVWADDYSTCKAVRSCTDDGCTEKQEFEATVTSKVTTTATCEVNEVVTYTATVTVDGTDYTDSKDVTGDKAPHTEVEIPAVAATCDKAGSTAGTKCSVCGTVITAPQPTEALGHSFTNYVSNDNATCTADGTETAKCDRCDVKDTRTVVGSKLGHDWEERYTWSTDYKTCTATRVCKNDANHNQGPKNATVTSETTPATCETDGSIVYTAKVTFDKECTTTQTVTLKAFGHNYGDPTFNWNDDYSACEVVKVCKNNPAEHVLKANATVTSETTPATCKADGKIVYTAAAVLDGKTVTDTQTVTLPKLDHSFGDWTVTKAASCKEAGIESRTCSACGKVETREIAKLAHTEQAVPGYAPTCGATGLTDGIICSVCGTVIKAQEVIPATGDHHDEDGDGICDDCGNEIKHEHVDADGDGKCDHCGQDIEVHHDNCICHKNNIFSKILRYICTLLTKICHKRVACCPDMEYYGGKIKDLT